MFFGRISRYVDDKLYIVKNRGVFRRCCLSMMLT